MSAVSAQFVGTISAADTAFAAIPNSFAFFAARLASVRTPHSQSVDSSTSLNAVKVDGLNADYSVVTVRIAARAHDLVLGNGPQ